MVSSDATVAQGKKLTFYAMLEEFSRYWERIDVICPHRPDAKETILFGNVYVHPAHFHRIFQPLFIYRTGSQLAGERHYDLVTSHDYGFFYNGVGTWLLWRRLRIPYVSEIHHVEGYPYAGSLMERFRRILTNLYLKWAVKRVAAVRVVNDKEMPGYLLRLGVPSEKILVLRSARIDLSIFYPRDLPKRYDLIFCGRFVSNKGLFLLLKAVAIARRSYPELKLVLKGNGLLKVKMERCIRRLNLERNVEIITDHLSQQQLAELYNQSRLLVMTSFNEGGPRVTLEAMACGTPVVTTPVGLMKELIREGENGLFIRWEPEDIAQKIVILLQDETRQRQMGEKGRLSVQQFDHRTIVKNYALGYRKLISDLAADSHAK